MKKYRYVLTTTAVLPIILYLIVFLAEGGHGTYAPVIAIVPFTMIGISFRWDESVLITLAILQLPIYGIFLDWSLERNKLRFSLKLVLCLHLFAVVVSMLLTRMYGI